MFNKKLLLGGLLTAVGSLGIAGVVLAYQGDPARTGPNHTPERKAAVEKAMTDGDYQAWRDMMAGRGRVTEMVNEKNFPRFAEAWKLRQEGKVEEANAIRQELGLGAGDGARNRQGNGQHHGRGRRGADFTDLNKDGVCDHLVR